MKVKEKLLMDINGLQENGPINIVILGDSISHGSLLNTIDYENVYWNVLKRKMNKFRDYVPVNMINASIGGLTATHALARLDKQVLKHEPDLVIVCFGLNDVNDPLQRYLLSLSIIFDRCQKAGSEVIFMTPNMLNTYVAEGTPEKYYEYAHKTAQMQNEGRMDLYMQSAVELARNMNVTVCDCYSMWKELAKTQDTTLLLVNRINHPTSEMHTLFADALYEIIVGQERSDKKSDSTMKE